MKRIGLLCAFLFAFSGFVVAMQTMGEQVQQKAAAAKEAAARNQQALRSYSWITKTELSVKGEVKNTKIESCKYGPDGKVQTTELTEPPPPLMKLNRPSHQRVLNYCFREATTAESAETTTFSQTASGS